MLNHETTTHRPRRSASMVCWDIGCNSNYTFTFIGVPMKTQEDLYLEYARVITMVREYNEKYGTDVKPWECVRTGHGYIFHKHPEWTGGHNNYTFAMAILEGKPVFVGDQIYGKSSGYTISAKQGHDWDLFTWTPPKKKRTFMLNGVELPCPLKMEPCPDNLNYATMCNDGHEFYFESCEHKQEWRHAITRLLEQARGKE